MKKIIVILFALLLLAGCSNANHYSSLSDGDEVIFSGPNMTYTKNDLYKSLKVSSENAVASDIIDKIALKLDGIDMEDINKQADELIETYQSMGYESYIISSYGSIDAYRKSYISTLLLSELSKAYVNEKFDELSADKKPVKMQLASFANEEDAKKCIEDVNNGSTFDMAAVNNNAANAPQSTVYTDDDTSLAYEVKDYLNSTDTTGVSTIIVSITSAQDASGNISENSTYYVLNVESRNVEDFRDEFIDLLATTVSSDDVRNHFLSSHEIEFFDQDLYKIMTEAFEVLK
ncbi:MAG: membrane lipoprotein lipid attachment site-containing protein [Erysipelotrichaceae bacterium]|nr:membrane lipoprotein lipid attachment site-containing protein [Erysipelotrichaceae bacterium]